MGTPFGPEFGHRNESPFSGTVEVTQPPPGVRIPPPSGLHGSASGTLNAPIPPHG